MNIRRAAPLNCASVCFQTVFNSAVTVNSIPKLSTDQVIGELLLAESLEQVRLKCLAVHLLNALQLAEVASVTGAYQASVVLACDFEPVNAVGPCAGPGVGAVWRPTDSFGQ